MCTICDKGFTSSHLKGRIHIHTGDKPYNCEVCKEQFSSSSCLKRHILKHNGNTPYTCQVYEKGLATKRVLYLHMLRHTGDFFDFPALRLMGHKMCALSRYVNWRGFVRINTDVLSYDQFSLLIFFTSPVARTDFYYKGRF